MGRLRALRELSACLRGEPPENPDWGELLALANQGLVTPGLAATLRPHIGQVPPQVWAFLEDVQRRNRERNRRLNAQLEDAVGALNGAGIEPVLLKGAAQMAACPPGEAFDRMLSDLDLMVLPAQVDDALRALTGAGFTSLRRHEGLSVHAVAELGRPEDVGHLDLHQRAPGPPGIADTEDLAARRSRLKIQTGTVFLPDTASQILYLVLHDQFHDGDYWRGGFDLRHLMDLARLTPELTDDDWRWLRGACATRLVRAALDAQLLSAARLVGPAGRAARADLHARWTHQRWRLQFAYPGYRNPLAALTLALEWPGLMAHRAANREGRQRVLGASAPEPYAPAARLDRVRRIMAGAGGKI
ncbi:MAG: nucleotidyltransferase family protein [Phenylobacterium sp.]|uniref:nucleotidyltransferase family protein n=1 Tax=Phenylobacterium sp. TaxID=1871053 RepID=UPI002730AB36|nr:nucleotidyltransferase family protein [Phenylobacterium sp.]MDP2011415.1 nucleotidyltransferase family protein [Phenylobacterium sp.]